VSGNSVDHHQFDEVAMFAHQIKALYDQPINIVNVSKFEMPITMLDNTAFMVSSMEDRMDDIKPINTTGDGNCVFNTASIVICKSELLPLSYDCVMHS